MSEMTPQHRMAIEDGVSPHLYESMTVEAIEAHRDWVRRFKAEQVILNADRDRRAREKAAEQRAEDERRGVLRYNGTINAHTGDNCCGVYIRDDYSFVEEPVHLAEDEVLNFADWLLRVANQRQRLANGGA